jgi:hypothetical protein
MSDPPKRRVVDPRVRSLDPPQRMVGVPSGRLLHGLANTCCTGEAPPNLPLLNTNTHTRRYGREAPKVASVPPFILFAPSSCEFVAAGTGVREPVLERSRIF